MRWHITWTAICKICPPAGVGAADHAVYKYSTSKACSISPAARSNCWASLRGDPGIEGSPKLSTIACNDVLSALGAAPNIARKFPPSVFNLAVALRRGVLQTICCQGLLSELP